jgi:hypothetical protein
MSDRKRDLSQLVTLCAAEPISMWAVAVVAQVQIGERLKYRKYFGFVLPKWHFGRGLAL